MLLQSSQNNVYWHWPTITEFQVCGMFIKNMRYGLPTKWKDILRLRNRSKAIKSFHNFQWVFKLFRCRKTNVMHCWQTAVYKPAISIKSYWFSIKSHWTFQRMDFSSPANVHWTGFHWRWSKLYFETSNITSCVVRYHKVDTVELISKCF